MFKLWFGGVVAATLLVEVIYAFPNGNINIASSEERPEDTPRDRFIMYVTKEYAELGYTFVEDSYSVFNKTIRIAARLDNREELQPLLLELEKFITRVNGWRKTKGNEYVEELLVIFEVALGLYQEFTFDDELDVPPNVAKLEKLLKQSGSESVSIKFAAGIIKLTSDVFEATEKYISQLSLSEKDSDPKLIKWYEQMKNEKDIEKRFEILGDFFDFMDFSD